jgi:F-type H+-transporting ATPase subunit b
MEHAVHLPEGLGDPTLWVLVAVLLFLGALLYFGIHKKIAGALDARADKIKAELDEARRLREEAQALLASYQRKQKEAEEQADEIVNQARHDAELMAAKSRSDLAERLERRAAMAEAKIASAEAQALSEVRARAADLALDAAQDLLRNGLSTAEKNKLVKAGIKNMGNMLS